MTWSLSVSGHSDDPDVNATVDALAKRLVDELVDSGSPAQGSYSNDATGESLTIEITASTPEDEKQADGGTPGEPAAPTA